MSSDDGNNMDVLCRAVADFVIALDWEHFHSPTTVASGLSVEAAELLEHFQWLDSAASRQLMEDPAKKEAVLEELADVVIYAMAFANASKADLADVIRRKLEKNAAKYPVERSKGKATL